MPVGLIYLVVSAANDNQGENFRKVKAPYIMKVRTKAHPSAKTYYYLSNLFIFIYSPFRKGVEQQTPVKQVETAPIPDFDGLFEDPDFVPSKGLLPESKKPKGDSLLFIIIIRTYVNFTI